MKRIKQLNNVKLLAGIVLILLTACENRDWNSPFDPDCPKEIFTPTGFTAKQEGEQVKLTWNQNNRNISGFKIERSLETGSFITIASPGKSENSVTNNISTGGKLHTYKIYALAGSNKSNEVTTTITPVLQAAITTKTATEITATSAVSGGTITDDGGGAITSRGVVWNTTGNPTMQNNSGKTTNGSGKGSYSSNLTGLTGNTNYYVRAYAVNSQGTAYGTQVSFTTTPPPFTVITTSPSNVTSSSAVLGGNVTSDGGAAVTQHGIVYSTSQNPTTSNNKVAIGSGTGTFSTTVSGLSANTTYYVRAYAINSQGTAYGPQVSFTTNQTLSPATVTTSSPANVTSSSAVLGGNVTDDGNATVTQRGIVYSTSQNPTTVNDKVAIGSGTGTFSTTVSGLSANTTYYVRAYAINSQGIAYGNQVNFTTDVQKSPPDVETNNATSITTNSAVLNGNVINDGNASINERGFYWSSTDNTPDSNDNIAYVSGQTGSYQKSISGLQDDTWYYFRAFATNSEGTSVGSVKSFKTESSEITKTLTATEDSHIIDRYPTFNDGSSPTMVFGVNNDNTETIYCLFKFNIGSIPIGSNVISAKMRLYVSSVRESKTTGVTIHKITGNWYENSVTWNNQPSTTDWISYAYNFTSTSPKKYYEFNVTDIVKNWIEDGQSPYGLLFKSSNNSVFINARESSSNKPQLVVTYE